MPLHFGEAHPRADICLVIDLGDDEFTSRREGEGKGEIGEELRGRGPDDC